MNYCGNITKSVMLWEIFVDLLMNGREHIPDVEVIETNVDTESLRHSRTARTAMRELRPTANRSYLTPNAPLSTLTTVLKMFISSTLTSPEGVPCSSQVKMP